MEAASRLLAVSSAATMNPSASTPMCSFRQSRRFFDALCLCAFHSPQPRIFSPVESTIKSIGPSWDRVRGGTATIWFRRERVVWSGALRVEAHQAEQRVQEPLGLAERQAEDDPQRQRGPDREVRVPPLASAKTVLRWYPRGNCSLAQPDRDVAAAPEATLVLPPVPDSVLRLVLAVDSARLRCDHDVTPPDLYDGLDPTPAASVLAYTDSCTNAIYLGQDERGARAPQSSGTSRRSTERPSHEADARRSPRRDRRLLE